MPHGGIVAFFALVPLLMAEYLAGESKINFPSCFGISLLPIGSLLQPCQVRLQQLL